MLQNRTCTCSNFRDRRGTSTESNCCLASLILWNDSCPSDLLTLPAAANAPLGLASTAAAAPVQNDAVWEDRQFSKVQSMRAPATLFSLRSTARAFMKLANVRANSILTVACYCMDEREKQLHGRCMMPIEPGQKKEQIRKRTTKRTKK